MAVDHKIYYNANAMEENRRELENAPQNLISERALIKRVSVGRVRTEATGSVFGLNFDVYGKDSQLEFEVTLPLAEMEGFMNTLNAPRPFDLEKREVTIYKTNNNSIMERDIVSKTVVGITI